MRDGSWYLSEEHLACFMRTYPRLSSLYIILCALMQEPEQPVMGGAQLVRHFSCDLRWTFQHPQAALPSSIGRTGTAHMTGRHWHPAAGVGGPRMRPFHVSSAGGGGAHTNEGAALTNPSYPNDGVHIAAGTVVECVTVLPVPLCSHSSHTASM